jgi:hypothetical protein
MFSSGSKKCHQVIGLPPHFQDPFEPCLCSCCLFMCDKGIFSDCLVACCCAISTQAGLRWGLEGGGFSLVLSGSLTFVTVEVSSAWCILGPGPRRNWAGLTGPQSFQRHACSILIPVLLRAWHCQLLTPVILVSSHSSPHLSEQEAEVQGGLLVLPEVTEVAVDMESSLSVFLCYCFFK